MDSERLVRAQRGRRARVLVAALAVVSLAGCGAGTSDGSVAVTLQEWAVLPAQNSVAAGKVTFSVKNSGPNDPHEMVVVRTETAPDRLPTDADGKVDEEAAGQLIGEIEEMAPGASESATFELTPGTYVLFCNIVEDEGGEKESHYRLGMFTAFTVK